jgi:hypothetical protein
LKKLFARIRFIIAIICSLTAASQYCFAQAAPDTALNNITTDTARQKIAMPGAVVKQSLVKPRVDATPLIAAKPKPFQPNPKKAGLYSALVPGLGQLYNRQYWKVPVVYVGLGVAGYFIIDNENNYQSYRKAYIGRINNNNPTDKYVGIYTQSQLQQLQNDYSRYLDLTVLLSALGYTLQVLDAITAAHLKNFDISRDISMHIAPVAMPNGVGLGLVMNF